jgi:hypothetical protein
MGTKKSLAKARDFFFSSKPPLFAVLTDNMYESTLDQTAGEVGHLFDLKVHLARNHSEKCVITGARHSISWVEAGASLAKNNVACFGSLITENLHPKTLGNRITAKVSRTTGFSVCHSFRYYVFITSVVY